MELSNKLRELRESRGESLRTVAAAVGLHPSNLARIELGDRSCPDKMKVLLAEHFGVSVEVLFFQRVVA